MERALLDILKEERDLVDSIYLSQQHYDDILRDVPDCPAKTIDLDIYRHTIASYKLRLDEVRQELSMYIKNLLL